jgi:hypothetical protein
MTLYEASVPNPEESELMVDLYFKTPGKQIGKVVGKAEVPQVSGLPYT